jgi:hypothetical protein
LHTSSHERRYVKDLYYIEQFSKDENGALVPMVAAVFADNDDEARELLSDSFVGLASVVEFGALRKAHRSKHGYIFGRGALVKELPPV